MGTKAIVHPDHHALNALREHAASHLIEKG
jgi:hypothetical protein